MSGQKKGFASFIRPVRNSRDVLASDSDGGAGRIEASQPQAEGRSKAPSVRQDDDGRIRTTTSTGRVRTFSASRQLPGITLRVTEERWERLKMMSIQERRPLQEIVSEAMDLYMRERGLPW